MALLSLCLRRCFYLCVGLFLALPIHAQETEASTEPEAAQTPGVETQAEKKPVPQSPRVLIMDLKNNGVADETLKTLQGVITVQISSYDALDVISGDDVRQLVALQAEKQNAGCDDSGSCMAEIAGALGASLVVFGDVGQLGELLVVNLNLFNVDLAQSQGRVTIEAPSLESFPGQLKPKIWDLLTPKMTALGFEVPERPEETEPVILVKEVPAAGKSLIAWPGAFLAGTLFLVGAGGAGYWYSNVSTTLQSLSDQKAILEENKDVLGALSKQNEIEALNPTHTIALASTIVTAALGLTGLALGIFMEPPTKEKPLEGESQEE